MKIIGVTFPALGVTAVYALAALDSTEFFVEVESC
jgi:hypothetical protein